MAIIGLLLAKYRFGNSQPVIPLDYLGILIRMGFKIDKNRNSCC